MNNNITPGLQIRYESAGIASCAPRNGAPALPGQPREYRAPATACEPAATAARAAARLRLSRRFCKAALKAKREVTARILVSTLTVNKC